jgi:diamine N-acetyltransferase
MTIKEVSSEGDFEVIEKLAFIIIPEHYNTFASQEQISYFLKKYQTANAIKEQINNGYRYYLIIYQGKVAGYFSIQHTSTKIILSKLYILKEYRRKKMGKKVIEFIVSLGRKSVIREIELDVNKNNCEAIDFYKSQGFEIIDTFRKELFETNFVEDYRMRKLIN